ncbi:MAG: GNAT family N-acetyltransferase [Turicibacter sp.]|nr:GNAT family N-acetyltransferase [Turicibacter sp.]
MEIRDYQKEDETGWVRCRVLAFLDTAYYDIVLRKKEIYKHPTIELVAIEDYQVVGLLDVEYEEEPNTICTAHETLGGMIWHLAVHPDYRCKGIGTALLEEAQKRLKDCQITYLEAWMRDDKWVQRWYLNRQFMKLSTYLHVYVNETNGIKSTISGLIPVQSFCQYTGEEREKIKKRYKRVHECTGFVKVI